MSWEISGINVRQLALMSLHYDFLYIYLSGYVTVSVSGVSGSFTSSSVYQCCYWVLFLTRVKDSNNYQTHTIMSWPCVLRIVVFSYISPIIFIFLLYFSYIITLFPPILSYIWNKFPPIFLYFSPLMWVGDLWLYTCT